VAQLDPGFCAEMPFSPRVARLVLAGGPLYVHAIEGEGLRPPTSDELPRTRYLAYGTSITHGGAATGPHLCYVAQAARRLGADLINLGVGGSAYCEPELADHIAARDDWHVASLALSVNMIGAGFTLDEFAERVSYMVNAVAGANTERPVVCVTIYPHFREFGPQFENPEAKGAPEQYRQRLRDVVAACPYPNVHLVEGAEILADPGGLTVDLIHPADNGMIQMGENLARRIAGLL
jgi:lysophospholipase L1-like esterase